MMLSVMGPPAAVSCASDIAAVVMFHDLIPLASFIHMRRGVADSVRYDRSLTR
jgi:hypothetical protein